MKIFPVLVIQYSLYKREAGKSKGVTHNKVLIPHAINPLQKIVVLQSFLGLK